ERAADERERHRRFVIAFSAGDRHTDRCTGGQPERGADQQPAEAAELTTATRRALQVVAGEPTEPDPGEAAEGSERELCERARPLGGRWRRRLRSYRARRQQLRLGGGAHRRWRCQTARRWRMITVGRRRGGSRRGDQQDNPCASLHGTSLARTTVPGAPDHAMFTQRLDVGPSVKRGARIRDGGVPWGVARTRDTEIT